MPIADTYSVVRTINKAGAINVYGFYPNFLLLLQEKIRGGGGGGSFSLSLPKQVNQSAFRIFRALLCMSLCPVLDNTKNVSVQKWIFFVKEKERTGLLHS